MASEALSHFPQGLVAFDLETTGLSPLFDKIVEMGAVKISADGTTSHFQELIQPGVPIPPENTLIHGITDSAVSDSPVLKEVLPRFMDFIGDASLVAHNAKFDTGFVVFALHLQGLPLPDNPIYCSLSLARKIFKEAPNNRLDTLAGLLSIPARRHHRAWDDASTCLQVTCAALDRLGKAAPERLSRCLIGALADYQRIESIPSRLAGLLPSVARKRYMSIKYGGGEQTRQLAAGHTPVPPPPAKRQRPLRPLPSLQPLQILLSQKNSRLQGHPRPLRNSLTYPRRPPARPAR